MKGMSMNKSDMRQFFFVLTGAFGAQAKVDFKSYEYPCVRRKGYSYLPARM
jgi:hypothetical protein